MGAVVLRLAGAGEEGVVARLAALDSAPRPRGGTLLALVDGTPVAALSLVDRRVVADPFVATQDAVALLRVRADQMANGGAPGGPATSAGGWWRGRGRRRFSGPPALA